ncbi:MAG TPA: hypothetical protein VIJ82_09765 [Streptosporangiaceae bacterium]|jgi:uncharacterized membrane protein YphA (DoxX/SURF4 family)
MSSERTSRSAASRAGGRTAANQARSRAPGRPGTAATIGGRAGRVTEQWAPTLARVLLGLVLAWFGFHELVQPSLWTGYVPLFSPTSAVAVILVLAHGWLLLVLAVAIIAGIATRAAAAAAAVLLLEIVISLAVTGGLSDLTLRDVGVLGLAVCLTGRSIQRLVLTG